MKHTIAEVRLDDELSKSINVDSFVQMVKDTLAYLAFGTRNTENKLGVPIIVVGNVENMSNVYLQQCLNELNVFYDADLKSSGVKCREYWWSCLKNKNYKNKEELNKIIRLINKSENIPLGRFYGFCNIYSKGGFYPLAGTLKLYLIFWNLFLCAIDEEVYNTQLCRVVELAHSFKLNENIMSDLCNAVEQLLSNQKLEAIFDINYSTEECTNFFFKKYEEQPL